MQVLKAMEQTVQAAPDLQVSLTDPGCAVHGHQRTRNRRGRTRHRVRFLGKEGIRPAIF